MEEERRQLARHRTFKGGRIFVPFRPGVDCLIRNLTEDGACVEVIGHAPLPENDFELAIKPEWLNRRCHVVWRKLNKIGVKFL